jgi:hypothetical protein
VGNPKGGKVASHPDKNTTGYHAGRLHPFYSAQSGIKRRAELLNVTPVGATVALALALGFPLLALFPNAQQEEIAYEAKSEQSHPVHKGVSQDWLK